MEGEETRQKLPNDQISVVLHYTLDDVDVLYLSKVQDRSAVSAMLLLL